MSRTFTRSLALLILALGPGLAAAQDKAGIATTVEGNVTVARRTLQPIALKFKDDVFLQDRVTTGDQSFARLLLGGKAVVTVRERSTLRITEVPGRSTIEMTTGKIGLAVARDRMRPGEVIDVRTPNAVLAVRGTVLVVEVTRPTASLTEQPGGVLTLGHTLSGIVSGYQRDPATGQPSGPPQNINAGFTFNVFGSNPGGITPSPPRDVILAGLGPRGFQSQGGSGQLTQQLMAITAGLLNNGLPVVPPPPPTPPVPEPTPDILPGGGNNLGGNNGGFQFPQDFTIVHTADGSVGQTSQNFTVPPPQGEDSVRPILVTGKIFLLSNEYPNFTGTQGNPNPQNPFNDTFNITFFDAYEESHSVFSTTANAAAAQGLFHEFGGSGGSLDGFEIGPENGVTDLINVSKQIVVAVGDGELVWRVEDIGDDSHDSAMLFNDFVVSPDPPLFFVHSGKLLERSDSLLDLHGATQAFDSLLFVCCDGSARLGGGVLRARDSNLDVPFSLVSVLQGGWFESTSTDPLVKLDGGNYKLGTLVGIFDIGGTSTGVDPESGLTVGYDEVFRHHGIFLEAERASIATENVLRVDTALLEATAPIINLLGGSTLDVNRHFLDVTNGQFLSTGGLARLVGSTLNVNGALVNVNGGIFRGIGSLLTLIDGSLVNLGVFGSVSRGGVFDWSGPLVTFSGTGNTLSVNNTLCATGSCVNVNGLNFALRNGATAANITVTNGTPFVGVGTSGSVFKGATTADFVVSGRSSQVRIGN